MKIIELETIGSTSEFLKEGGFTQNTAAIAKTQTSGKGTKGRSFSSGEGGLYISFLNFYQDFPAKDAFKIMIKSAVSVARTLESFGVNPTIKWPNDVYLNGKKICGILIENVLSSAHICHSIVGIGVNLNNVLPPEISEIAITLKDVLKREIDLNDFKNKLIKNFSKDYTIKDYKQYLDWLGQEVVLKTDVERTAKSIDVDESGNLIVFLDGEIKKISSAEVSLRI